MASASTSRPASRSVSRVGPAPGNRRSPWQPPGSSRAWSGRGRGAASPSAAWRPRRPAPARLLGRAGSSSPRRQTSCPPQADGPRGARLRAQEPGRAASRDGSRIDARSSGWASPTLPIASRSRCPVASSSASRSRASWRWARACSSSTSRRPSSTQPGRRRPPICSRSWRTAGAPSVRERPGGARTDGPLPRARGRAWEGARSAGEALGLGGGSRRALSADARSARPRRRARPRALFRRGRRGGGTAAGPRGGSRRRVGAPGRDPDSPGATWPIGTWPGHRAGIGRRSGSRSTGSSIATRAASRPSAALARDRARGSGGRPGPERVGQDDAGQAPRRPPPT